MHKMRQIYIYRLFNIFENAQNQIFALIISLNKRCPFKIYERFQMQIGDKRLLQLQISHTKIHVNTSS